MLNEIGATAVPTCGVIWQRNEKGQDLDELALPTNAFALFSILFLA